MSGILTNTTNLSHINTAASDNESILSLDLIFSDPMNTIRSLEPITSSLARDFLGPAFETHVKSFLHSNTGLYCNELRGFDRNGIEYQMDLYSVQKIDLQTVLSQKNIKHEVMKITNYTETMTRVYGEVTLSPWRLEEKFDQLLHNMRVIPNCTKAAPERKIGFLVTNGGLNDFKTHLDRLKKYMLRTKRHNLEEFAGFMVIYIPFISKSTIGELAEDYESLEKEKGAQIERLKAEKAQVEYDHLNYIKIFKRDLNIVKEALEGGKRQFECDRRKLWDERKRLEEDFEGERRKFWNERKRLEEGFEDERRRFVSEREGFEDERRKLERKVLALESKIEHLMARLSSDSEYTDRKSVPNKMLNRSGFGIKKKSNAPLTYSRNF